MNAAALTTSVELTNSYRGSFPQHSNLDEIASLEDGEKTRISDDKTLVDAKDRYYSSPRYLGISEGSTLKHTASKIASVQTEEVIKESSGLADRSKYDRNNLAFH